MLLWLLGSSCLSSRPHVGRFYSTLNPPRYDLRLNLFTQSFRVIVSNVQTCKPKWDEGGALVRRPSILMVLKPNG